jgi:tRNA A-37 threonylcarbamoyl transferase component Bud32
LRGAHGTGKLRSGVDDSRDPRTLRACVRAARSLDRELVVRLAEQSEHWFGSARVPLPDLAAKRELALVESPLGRLVAKRVRRRGLRGALARVRAGTGRAERAFELAHALAEAGLATPEALLVLRCGAERVLVTRYVAAPRPWEFLAAGGTAEELVAVLARDLARLHAAGFRHRDLKASNLLVRRAQKELEVVWTDLDGLFRPARLGLRSRQRDLARLGMSFESAAARAAGVRAGDWPELVRQYLAAVGGRVSGPRAFERTLAATRAWRERAIRAHLARGDAVR